MDEFFPLTDKQQESIEISRQQIKNGQFSTNEEVMIKMKNFVKKMYNE